MKKWIILFFVGLPFAAWAQQPKMYLKAFGGINSNTFVYRVEGEKPDFLLGWQFGAGFRVDHRSAFAELDLTFIQYGVKIFPEEDSGLPVDEPINIAMRAFEVPVSMGYIPVKTPLFKWFLYGGLVNRFSLRGKLEYLDEETKIKPKEAGLHFYNLGARFGTQVDVAMFNFDFNYTIGITNGLREKIRTNLHTLQLSAGFVF